MIGINGFGNMPLSGYIYGGYQGSYAADVQSGDDQGKVGAVKNPGESTKVAPGRKSSPAECQTCKERKYQDGSDEMVVKFILTRKSASEAFRYIKLAINDETKLIRRIEAVTPKGEEFVFNFFDYALNQNLSEQRFVYDAPSSANNYNNFLFTE